ncbi:MAG: hypothetical protein ACFBRM_08775 [Pikeienuella sp.]
MANSTLFTRNLIGTLESRDGDGVPFTLLGTELDSFWTDLTSFGSRIEERRENLDDLRGLSGDPEKVEGSDLDASENFDLTQNEDGTLNVSGPKRSFETERSVEAEINGFADLGQALRDRVEEMRGRITEVQDRIEELRGELDELRGLTGDTDRLEGSDLDASEDFDLSQNEDGTLVITGPNNSFETNRPIDEEIDGFEDLGDTIRDRADDLRSRLDEARENFEELKAGSGDPDALETSDFDASESYEVRASEDGDVVLVGPNREVETQIPFGEDTDSFVEVQAWIEADLEALMALEGDEDALEAADLDASEDYFITQSTDGNVVINYIDRAYETQIAFSEETDSFVELAQYVVDEISSEVDGFLG